MLIVSLLALTIEWGSWFYYLICCVAAIEARFGLVILVIWITKNISSFEVKNLFLVKKLNKITLKIFDYKIKYSGRNWNFSFKEGEEGKNLF